MNVIAIIQARMNSSRLPGKVLLRLAEKPMLQNIIERASRSTKIDKVIVATSDQETDNPIEQLCNLHDYKCFRGDLENVLKRFYECAMEYKAQVIVRLTADNALIDPIIIDEAVEIFLREQVDYLYYKASLPLGMCVEVIGFEALEKAYKKATDKECLEHVTPFIRRNQQLFNVIEYKDNDKDLSKLRFTMDTEKDYEFIKRIYECFETNSFSFMEVLNVLDNNPELTKINEDVNQNRVSYCGEREEGALL